jgi:glycosyltransferase involved in cell wall biosynthesis
LISSYPKSIYDASSRNYSLKKQLFVNKANMCIVTVSDWMHALVKKSFLKSKAVEVIKNGVNLSTFTPCSKKMEKFTILGVASSWSSDKGLDDFIKLRGYLSVEDYDIILIGLTDRQKTELPDGIVGICRTNSVEELTVLYSAASVLVNMTYADTFPTVNLEALACGTPVITYDTGGSPEAVDDKTGIVVPQGDIAGVAKAISDLKITQLSSDACRQRAIELFDQDKCYRKYIDLYDKLLAKSH